MCSVEKNENAGSSVLVAEKVSTQDLLVAYPLRPLSHSFIPNLHDARKAEGNVPI